MNDNSIKCKTCGVLKNVSDFYKSHNKIRHVCKECVKEKERIKYRKNSDEIIAYKSSIGCKKCGDKRGFILEFHHTNPNEKDYEIGKSTHHVLKNMMDEISKCDVLCANCHREFHYLYSNSLIKSYNDWLGE